MSDLGSTDLLLLYPELLSEHFLRLTLEQKNIPVDSALNDKQKLTDIYVQHVIPLPQRSLPKSRWGKKIEEKRGKSISPTPPNKRIFTAKADEVPSSQLNMEKYTQATKTPNQCHLATCISAADRAKSYSKVMRADDGIMFCVKCNVPVDHVWKHTVEQHLQTQKHMKRCAEEALLHSPKHKRQTTVATSFGKASTSTAAKSARNDLICRFMKLCTAVNIPLSKCDHPVFREFLHTDVRNGGAIPKSHQLQERYLPERYMEAKEELKQKMQNLKISVIFDETPDAKGRCVLNILFAAVTKKDGGKIKSYLADTVFLQQCNNETVARAVVKVLTDYDIKFEDVVGFNTDNAAYMLKAYRCLLKSLYPNAKYITCLAHILNLIGETFRKPFVELNEFILYFSRVFYMASSRKRRYLEHLNNHSMKARMAPDPCSTRWNSWFAAVLYHCKHFHTYAGFFKSELDLTKSPPESLECLQAILNGEAKQHCIKLQLDLVADKCQSILQLTDLFQSQTPITMKVYDYLEDLQMNFTSNSVLTTESMQTFLDAGAKLSLTQKKKLVEQLRQTFENVLAKLDKYMNEGQPGLQFLKQVRLFNPAWLSILPKDKYAYSAIPGIAEVPNEEFQMYMDAAGPQAGTASVCGVIDTNLFWHGMADRLPVLSKVAFVYKDCVTSSADAERSNSIYKLIFSCRRRSLSEESIRALVFLHYNSQVLHEDSFVPENSDKDSHSDSESEDDNTTDC